MLEGWKHRKLSGGWKGAIAGGALALGVATGGVWASAPSTPAPAHQASGCAANHFMYRHNLEPCSWDGSGLRKMVGQTGSGCVLGALGGPEGIFPGCLGGLVSLIPW